MSRASAHRVLRSPWGPGPQARPRPCRVLVLAKVARSRGAAVPCAAPRRLCSSPASFSLGFASSSANLILHTISIGICPRLLGLWPEPPCPCPSLASGPPPPVPSGVAAVAAAALRNSGQAGGGQGQGGGPRWGSHSHSQQLRSPAAAASAAACLSPLSAPCGFLISTSTAVSPCVCPCERASEGVSAAPPRRAAPAAPLSMCSGAHPVLNNSGHVNSASPAPLAAGARPGAGGSPPTAPPHPPGPRDPRAPAPDLVGLPPQTLATA